MSAATQLVDEGFTVFDGVIDEDTLAELRGLTDRVIPSSHKLGYLPWHRVKGETHHDRLNMDLVDENEAIFVELAAGDALIFDAMLVHSSEKVDVEEPRRAYRVSYQGFDLVMTPRGSPIVMRGGQPESVATKFPDRYVTSPSHSMKVFLRKVGKRLARL